MHKVVEEQTAHLRKRVDDLQGELGKMALVVDENQTRSEVAEQRASELERVSALFPPCVSQLSCSEF